MKGKILTGLWLCMLGIILGWTAFLILNHFLDGRLFSHCDPADPLSVPTRIPATLPVDGPTYGYTGPCDASDSRGGRSVCLDYGRWQQTSERIEYPDQMRGNLSPRGTQLNYKQTEWILCVPGQPPVPYLEYLEEPEPDFRCTEIYSHFKGQASLFWSLSEVV